jgi:hypothetical protein
VLDASALLAWLVQERGAEVVGEYLPRSRSPPRTPWSLGVEVLAFR